MSSICISTVFLCSVSIPYDVNPLHSPINRCQPSLVFSTLGRSLKTVSNERMQHSCLKFANWSWNRQRQVIKRVKKNHLVSFGFKNHLSLQQPPEYRTSMGIQMVDLCLIVKWPDIRMVWKLDWKKPAYGPKCPVFKWSAKSHDFTIWTLGNLYCPVSRWIQYSGVKNSDGYCIYKRNDHLFFYIFKLWSF